MGQFGGYINLYINRLVYEIACSFIFILYFQTSQQISANVLIIIAQN